jgi:hypothetical protein
MVIGDTIRGKANNVVDVIEYKNAFFGEHMTNGVSDPKWVHMEHYKATQKIAF